MRPLVAGVLTALLMFAGPVLANPEPDRAAMLIRSLGSPSFQTREKASKDLLQLGRSAYPALLTGVTDANPEVRFRCRQLLPRIYDMELQARLDAFLADTEGKKDHDLPGLARFRKFFGFDQNARDFFVSMLRADGRLMDAVENQPTKFADEKLAVRCSQLQPRMNQRVSGMPAIISQGEVGQLLFLGLHPEVKLGQQTIAQINQFLYRPELRNWMITGDPAPPLMKKLLLAWLDKNIDDANTGYMITNLSQTLQLKELIEPALKIAANAKAFPHVRANVLSAIGRLGDKDTISKLEPIIADTTQVQQFAFNNLRGWVQVGDVALAMAIHLTGQKPADYGYEAVKQNPNWINSYYYLGFENDSQRSAAKKKWKDWQEAQKKK
jgi:hypothetical protein